MSQPLTHTPEPRTTPIRYPENGAPGTCRDDRPVTYVCGTNGPGPGTWYHQDDSTPCRAQGEPAAAPCARTTTSRTLPADAEQDTGPSPYTVGEHIHCPACGHPATVTRAVANDRSAGMQYVAHLTHD